MNNLITFINNCAFNSHLNFHYLFHSSGSCIVFHTETQISLKSSSNHIFMSRLWNSHLLSLTWWCLLTTAVCFDTPTITVEAEQQNLLPLEISLQTKSTSSHLFLDRLNRLKSLWSFFCIHLQRPFMRTRAFKSWPYRPNRMVHFISYLYQFIICI